MRYPQLALAGLLAAVQPLATAALPGRDAEPARPGDPAFGPRAASAGPGSAAAGAPDTPPNVLILVADDLGVDMVGAYGEGPDPPLTPAIDALAAGGVLFRNAWSNPVCSPTRATLQTGRYSWRTGIGMQIAEDATTELDPTEVTLPGLLAAHPSAQYATAAIGKWHLGNDPASPHAAGYDHFAGSLGNIHEPHDYFRWPLVVNGAATTSSAYATTETVDQALEWIGGTEGPWLCYVAFHAPHSPFHTPPDELHSVTLPDVDPRLEPRPFYKAMVEAMDAEIGRLLAGIGPELDHTHVFFVGDNGTPEQAAMRPFVPEHAKLTPYEGGINVPLVVSGPGVLLPGESAALVNTTDVFATIAELLEIDLDVALPPAYQLDSVSLAPFLEDPGEQSRRTTAYAELFLPNQGGLKEKYWHMLRDERFKLIVRREQLGVRRELYDLLTDPFERRNLLGGPMAPWVQRVLIDMHGKLAQELFPY